MKSKPIRSRLGQLIDEIFSTPSDQRHEWSHPDYAAAAIACEGNEPAQAKLAQLAHDLECRLNLAPGPGTFLRLARFTKDDLKSLAGRCWREVLTDSTAGPRVWAAIRNFSTVLKAEQMDDASRRTGVVLHAVAIKRLEEGGEIEADIKSRKRHMAEREFVCAQTYVPAFILTILRDN